MDHQQAQYLNIGWHPPAPSSLQDCSDRLRVGTIGREPAHSELRTPMCLLLFKPEEKAHADEGILQEGLEEGDPSFVDLDQR